MQTPTSTVRLGSKRAVNLTLSESLVNQTKLYSNNLSATVEALLMGYVDQQSKASQQKVKDAQIVSVAWNAVNEQIGSFADEYSNL
jgi:antitoxin CcdA